MATDLGTSSPKIMVMKVTSTNATAAAKKGFMLTPNTAENASAPNQPKPMLATVTPS
jgi:hypothetical protein